MSSAEFPNIPEGDRRRVYGPGETPAEPAQIILPELDKLIAEGSKRGGLTPWLDATS